MSATTLTPVWSGFCNVNRHHACRGLYGGHPCPCDCHQESDPEPEPPPAAEHHPAPSSPRRHCATCSCEDHR